MTGLGSGIPPIEEPRILGEFDYAHNATESSALQFAGVDIRHEMIGDGPWFVAADIARVLGYREAYDLTRILDEDEKGPQIVRTPGGPQTVIMINEAGLYSAIMRSRAITVREFKRWVTHEVLPSIRRTGAYVTPETPEQQLARALVTAQGIIDRKDEQIATLTPRAEAWDDIASADGDYSVADAAKMLARREIETGPQRLFEQLADLGWIFRGSQGKWRPYATAVDAGYLAERPQSHHHPRTGEVVLDPPQVRVTLRGLERLRIRLGVLKAVEVAS